MRQRILHELRFLWHSFRLLRWHVQVTIALLVIWFALSLIFHQHIPNGAGD